MTKIAEMKDCPFCGSYPEVVMPALIASWMVHCESWKCHVRPSVLGDTKEEAVERWNIRFVAASGSPAEVPPTGGEMKWEGNNYIREDGKVVGRVEEIGNVFYAHAEILPLGAWATRKTAKQKVEEHCAVWRSAQQ